MPPHTNRIAKIDYFQYQILIQCVTTGYSSLVGMQNYTTTLENSLAVSNKTIHNIAITFIDLIRQKFYVHT
jgi:hypothetical protein